MADEHHVNATAHAATKELAAHAAAAAVNCWVSQQPIGAPVTQVKQSGFGANNLYWMNLNNTQVLHTLDFIVTFKPGSPLTTQRQHFAFPGGGYAGSVTTPFGVPFWGGNPIIGPAILTVIANGIPVGHFKFNVVP